MRRLIGARGPAVPREAVAALAAAVALTLIGTGAAATLLSGTGSGTAGPASGTAASAVDVNAPSAGLADPSPRALVPVPQPVAPFRSLHEADLLVTGTAPMSDRLRRELAGYDGVVAATGLDLGSVNVAGTPVRGVAVDPSVFRSWTPGPTARSNGLWHKVAEGDLTASFELGHNVALPLGGLTSVTARRGHGRAELPLGALASLALPGIDVMVAKPVGRALGFVPSAGMLLSAPQADLPSLRSRLRDRLGPRFTVLLLRDDVIVRDAGEFLTRNQLATVIAAAESRVGAPYVWGATGPDRFDCSGLVGYAFAAAGIALPRTSEQLWFAGPHVPSTDARPGDLLFWANDPAAPMDMDHVAIYLGGGMMISAPHTGDVVHVAPVGARNFRGIVRVDPATALQVGGALWAPGDPGSPEPSSSATPAALAPSPPSATRSRRR